MDRLRRALGDHEITLRIDAHDHWLADPRRSRQRADETGASLDLSHGARAPVIRDVEIAVRRECHASRHVELTQQARPIDVARHQRRPGVRCHRDGCCRQVHPRDAMVETVRHVQHARVRWIHREISRSVEQEAALEAPYRDLVGSHDLSGGDRRHAPRVERVLQRDDVAARDGAGQCRDRAVGLEQE